MSPTGHPSWLEFSEFPFKAMYHFIGDGSPKNHYIDEGSGEAIVFIHGIESWSFTFRNLIKELMGEYRCLAMDFLGFGMSDRRWAQPYSWEDQAMQLENWIVSLNLSQVHLVMLGTGAFAGLSYASKYPEKVAELILINGITEQMPSMKNPLIRWWNLGFHFPFRWRLKKMGQMSKIIRNQYTVHFKDPGKRKAYLDLKGQAMPGRVGANCNSPLPNAPALDHSRKRLVKSPGRGHFAHEEAAETVLTEIRQFLLSRNEHFI